MISEKELLKKYDISFFEKDLSAFDICLNERQMCQFLKYYELLTQWNSFMNLTAITDYKEVIKKHFIDSISLILCEKVDLKNMEKVIDVGTGAGFPGIPLKIIFPHFEMTLLDSLQKRVKFLNAVVEELKLKKIKTIHGRAEDLGRNESMREKYDVSVSRAVADLSVLSEYCIPFVKKNGYFISYKSEKGNIEAKRAEKVFCLLGGSVVEIKEFFLPDSDIHRTIIVVKKERETHKRFPRKAGLPSKEPLCQNRGMTDEIIFKNMDKDHSKI